jgi:hypothetical protein
MGSWDRLQPAAEQLVSIKDAMGLALLLLCPPLALGL